MPNSYKIRIEQKSGAFKSDLANCHGFSVNNLGTTRVRFGLTSGGGEMFLEPGESTAFDAGENVPFAKDVISGEFEKLTKEELELTQAEYDAYEHTDLCRISKKIGSDECP